MTPRELLRLLMEQQGLNPNSLSKKLDGKTKQPQIHRFLKAESTEPRRSTLKPVADFFKIPLEALFSEDEAAKAAESLGLLQPGLLEGGEWEGPSEQAPAQDVSLDQALTVVLDAISKSTDKSRLRTALMAMLEDDDDAYRDRVKKLLAPTAEPAKPRLAAHRYQPSAFKPPALPGSDPAQKPNDADPPES